MGEDAAATDEALMASYRAGQLDAFEVLFSRYSDAMVRFFLRSYRDRGLAEDLSQQVFLRMHRGRDTFEAGRSFWPWLYAIAGRIRQDEWRRRQRSLEDLDAEGEPERHAGPATTEEGPGGTAALRLEAALAELTEPQRQILHLHRVEGMTFREIGEVLQLSEGAVKLRAFRSYEKLRALMGATAKGGA
jgi:RNA polymerase sigma factor (sigma-70 family)